MKKIIKIISIIILSAITVSFVNYKINYTHYSTVVPINASGTGSSVTTAQFQAMLPAGAVAGTNNVFVKPADGIAFTNIPNGDFYRWTEQMYLWLLSPVPATGQYGSCSGLVLNSPEFYDVSPEGAQDPITGLNAPRTMTRHICSSSPIVVKEVNSGRNFNVFDVKSSMSFEVKGRSNGAHNLPILFEKGSNKNFELEKTPLSPDGKQLIYDSKKNKIEVGKIRILKGKPVIYDTNGNEILFPKLILRKGLDEFETIQNFEFKKTTISLANNPILQENIAIGGGGGVIVIQVPIQGQATEDVLMTKSGSLVYYNAMVNDVYAVFLTMVKNGVANGGLPPTAKFPTTAAEMTVIQSYATAHGITIIEPNSLAMELKTSWIETINIPSSSINDYVKVRAEIPKYVQTSPGLWTRSGTKIATLALVGIHIVGSVNKHPEMIWGSVEHINNTPNPAYSYKNTSNTNSLVPADTNFGTGTPWLFSSATATTFNISHMVMSNTDIFATTDISTGLPFPISGSDTQRVKPFGFGGAVTSAPGGVFTYGNSASQEALSNAQIIATNTDINSKLHVSDIRRKYFMIGATWNAEGTGLAKGQQVGTNQLSNSTMETYSQPGNGINNVLTGQGLTNCFGCHKSEIAPDQDMPQLQHINGSASLSHIFNMNPL